MEYIVGDPSNPKRNTIFLYSLGEAFESMVMHITKRQLSPHETLYDIVESYSMKRTPGYFKAALFEYMHRVASKHGADLVFVDSCDNMKDVQKSILLKYGKNDTMTTDILHDAEIDSVHGTAPLRKNPEEKQRQTLKTQFQMLKNLLNLKESASRRHLQGVATKRITQLPQLIKEEFPVSEWLHDYMEYSGTIPGLVTDVACAALEDDLEKAARLDKELEELKAAAAALDSHV